jgi:hypothetical protein
VNFLDTFSKNNQIKNLMKIRFMGAELFREEDGRKDRHDAAYGRFSQIGELA